jgi:hypothetical protein
MFIPGLYGYIIICGVLISEVKLVGHSQQPAAGNNQKGVIAG